MSTGAGGLDWAGFEFVVALLGVSDIDGLVDRLLTIKLHRPTKPEDTE